MEGHAIEVNDAFGMAKMQPSGPKKKNRNGRSSEGNDGNVLGSFDGDMQGVLGVGWRDRDRQRRRKERQRAGLDFKEGGGGGGGGGGGYGYGGGYSGGALFAPPVGSPFETPSRRGGGHSEDEKEDDVVDDVSDELDALVRLTQRNDEVQLLEGIIHQATPGSLSSTQRTPRHPTRRGRT